MGFGHEPDASRAATARQFTSNNLSFGTYGLPRYLNRYCRNGGGRIATNRDGEGDLAPVTYECHDTKISRAQIAILAETRMRRCSR
jgi:hypothetical protein